MKKALKIIGITLLVIVLLLVAIPFVFQGKIKDIVKNTINSNVNAQVEFTDINLSFIRSFPQAQVDVSDLEITNFAPFKDEKLASIKTMSLTMSIKELFKKASEGPVVINEFKINEALIVLKTNKLGETNYDIAKPSDEKTPTNVETNSGFTLDVQDYSINNSALTYIDEGTNTIFYITELNHSGKGTFSGNVSELDTKTSASLTLSMDSTEYLSNHNLKLDAIIGLDLPNNKYTFKENTAHINDLPLQFQGYVQLLEVGQELDISFENPGSDFKEFLAVIPKTYSKDIENVQTSGNFKITGRVNGLISEETIPQMDINIVSNNASFKYPDLPKGVEQININTSIKNTTGKPVDTYVDISTLNFKIDQDQFNASATLRNLTENMAVSAYIDGILNLANISQAYPIELDTDLTGILKAKINTAFDMNAIETNAYQRIKSDGSVQISNFIYASEDIVNPISISNADLTFKPGTVALNKFEAQSGQSDINANGTITNLLGFLLSDKKLQGNFNVNANTFNISDFMVADTDENGETNKTTDTSVPLKIPAFLDCTINADAKTVIYDNLTLKNTKGNLAIKDQVATLNNLNTNIFDGSLAVSGDINTQQDTPKFNLKLNADAFDITESFTTLDLLKVLAPIAKIFEGKLNTDIVLNGNLDSSFSPILSSVTGNAFAELLTTKTKIENSPLLSTLDSKLNFIDIDKLDLNDLKTNLTFSDGQVNIKPFMLQYKDIDIAIGGSHGFDQTMNYDLAFNVPAKYLGSDINRLIGKINDPEVNKISIPITANLQGTFKSPKISTDLSSSVTKLTQQLIEIEKQKLINQGTNAIKDLLGGLNSGTNSNTTSTPIDSTTVQTDSTKTNPPKTEETIKNILGGLLNKNKKKKDSTN